MAYPSQHYHQSAAPQRYQQLASIPGAAPEYNAHRLKAAQKLEGRTWEKDGQAALYLMRGATFSPIVMTGGELDNIIRDVAHPHPGLHALLTFSAIDIAAFSPPRPTGVAAVTRPFDVHLDTFIRVLEVFIKDGMAGASPAGADRVGLFFRELFRISEDLRRYSSRHCAEFKGREADVFARFKQDANLDWADFVSRLTTEARALRQCNTLAPLPPNTVGAIQVPQFSRTLVLIAEGTASSMVGLLQGGLARQQQSKPSSASTKCKATSQGHPARGPVAPVSSASTAAATAFAPTVAAWNTPNNECFYTWSGTTCTRPQCEKGHTQRHPSLLPASRGTATEAAEEEEQREEEEVEGVREEAVAVPIRDGAGPTFTSRDRQGGVASLARERTPSLTAEGQ
ncbi:unnamed protein product [Ectocarpus sp. CCAP 1310/34]|nr:unnamed protein product [Ectocarpus sp. CCAP 1310/34]